MSGIGSDRQRFGEAAPEGSPIGSVVAGVAGSAALIAVITVGARVTGFGRVFAFSAAVGGGGCIGTAYTTANQIPNVLFEVAAGGALAGAVVPVLAGLLAQGRREDADRVASALLGWAIAVLLPIAALLALAAGPLVGLLLNGPQTSTSCPGGVSLGAGMLVVFAPQVVLYGIGIVLSGVLQAHRRFAWPALVPLLSSLVMIASYLAFGALAGGRQSQPGWRPDTGTELVLTGGTTLGVVALSLPLLWPVRRTGTRLRLTLRFPSGTATRIRSLAAAGVGALLAQQAAVVATLALANRVGGSGAINVLQFAQAVYLLPYAVLAVPLATAAFPRLSEQFSRGDLNAFAGVAASTARLVVLVSCFGAGLLIAAAPAVQALFLGVDAVGGGPFRSLGAGLAALAPGLVGWSLVAHFSRVLYAAGRGRPAALATASGWAVAVLASVGSVLGLSAAGWPGDRAAVVGLGVGNTAGMLVAGVLLVRAVRRVAGPPAVRAVPAALGVGVASSVVATVAGRLATDRLLPSGGRTAAVLPALGAGAVAALVALLVFTAVLALLDRRDLVALLARVRVRRSGRPA